MVASVQPPPPSHYYYYYHHPHPHEKLLDARYAFTIILLNSSSWRTSLMVLNLLDSSWYSIWKFVQIPMLPPDSNHSDGVIIVIRNIDDAKGMKRIKVPTSNGIVDNSSTGTSNTTVLIDGEMAVFNFHVTNELSCVRA